MEDAAWLAAEGKTTLAAAVSKHLLRAPKGWSLGLCTRGDKAVLSCCSPSRADS